MARTRAWPEAQSGMKRPLPEPKSWGSDVVRPHLQPVGRGRRSPREARCCGGFELTREQRALGRVSYVFEPVDDGSEDDAVIIDRQDWTWLRRFSTRSRTRRLVAYEAADGRIRRSGRHHPRLNTDEPRLATISSSCRLGGSCAIQSAICWVLYRARITVGTRSRSPHLFWRVAGFALR
jgi:hypothetical protein